MKYQGNFNICNLSLIDDYFKNGKALVYQYKNMILKIHQKFLKRKYYLIMIELIT